METPLQVPALLRPRKPVSCGGCALEHKGSAFIPGIGAMQSGLAIIGEAPGEKEEKFQIPFHPSGQSGALLGRAIRIAAGAAAGPEGSIINRDQFHILNAVNCRPPGNSFEGAWTAPVIQQCFNAHVAPFLHTSKPRAILALGNTALKSLTGFGNGKKAAIAAVRGFYLEGTHPALQGIPIVGSYHPSFILRAEKPSLLHILAQDMIRALGYATRGAPSRPHEIIKHWRPSGTPEDLRALIRWMRDNPNAPAFHDIETDKSQVDDESAIRGTEDGRLLTWSATTGEDHDPKHLGQSIIDLAEEVDAEAKTVTQPEDAAYVVPSGRWETHRNIRITQFHIALSREWAVSWTYTPENWLLYLEFLALSNPKYHWNGRLYDNPILRAYGAKIGGLQIDWMDVAHHYFPDWPRGLQSMTSHQWPELGPWKHMAGVNDGYYGCCDVAAPWAIADPKTGLGTRIGAFLAQHNPRENLGEIHTSRTPDGSQITDPIELRIGYRIRRHLVDFGAVLDKVQDHGIPVDVDKHREFKTYLKRTIARLNRHLQHYIKKWTIDLPQLQQWHNPEGYAPQARLGKKVEWAMATGAEFVEEKGHRYYLHPCTREEDVIVLNEKGKPLKEKGAIVTRRQLVEHKGFRSLIPRPTKALPLTDRLDVDGKPLRRSADELVFREVEVELTNPDNPTETFKGKVWRWCLPNEWNPNSSVQLLDYLRARIALEEAQLLAAGKSVRSNAAWYIPENPNERGKDWTGTKGLERLNGAGPKAWRLAYEFEELDNEVRNARHKTELDKWLAKHPRWAIGQGGDLFEAAPGRVLVRNYDRANDGSGKPRYVRDPILLLVTLVKAYTKLEGFVKAWTPGPDGLVHTSFGFGPATGQISSKSPNVQQYPKHGAIAGKFRNIIVARTGKCFVSADFSGFHAITTGFEAGDPDYVRLARLDIHSYLTAQGERLPGAEYLLELPDTELAEKLDWIKGKYKHQRDTIYKRTVLGVQFGMGPGKMHRLNPEVFPTIQAASRPFGIVRRHFPRIFTWQDEQRDKAHRQRFLLSRYAYLRWFWSVKTWSKEENKWIPGQDSEKCVAFEPANDAFGIVRDVFLDFAEDRHPRTGESMLDYCGVMNNVHDSIEAEPLIERRDEVIDYMSRTMTKPRPILHHPIIAPNGLWCDVEISTGPNMGEKWAEGKKRFVPEMEKVLLTRDNWLKKAA